MPKEKCQLTPAEKDLIRREIEYYVPSYLSDLCNASLSQLQCEYKKEILSITADDKAITDILIYKDKVIKVFCLNNTKEAVCNHKKNESKTCQFLK